MRLGERLLRSPHRLQRADELNAHAQIFRAGPHLLDEQRVGRRRLTAANLDVGERRIQLAALRVLLDEAAEALARRGPGRLGAGAVTALRRQDAALVGRLGILQ